jgi:hypothetical protein
MKKIMWLVGGLEVPGVGITKTGRSAEIDDDMAESLLAQGIAKMYKNPKKIKTKKEDEFRKENEIILKTNEDFSKGGN